MSATTTVSLKNRERILEAIDQLRHRKARPDIQRICAYLFRRFHVNSAEAKADLEWCVENNIVLKVEYKGSISYRNAAKKYAQMNKHREHHVDKNTIAANINKTNSKNFMELITNVFGELIVQEPDYLELGVPPEEIIQNILSKDSVRYTKNYIAILMVREIENGNIIKLPNGNYLMGPSADSKPENKKSKYEKQEKIEHHMSRKSNIMTVTTGSENMTRQHITVKAKKRPLSKGNNSGGVLENAADRKFAEIRGKLHSLMESSHSSMDEKKSSGGNVRVGGRRKRAKKVFDPSDIHIPKKRGRPAGSLNRSTIEKQSSRNSGSSNDDSRPDSRTSSGSRDHCGVCSVCHVQNKRGPHDRMVACRECSNKAHFSCLNGDDMMLKMYPDNTWQCPHCKTCVVCYETSDAGYLTVCSVCADGYHASCHQPRITEKIKNGQRWLCVNCQMPDELKINQIQSNIGDTFSQNLNSNSNSNMSNEKDHQDRQSNHSNNSNQSNHSASRSSTPSDYNYPPLTPTPPQLSPQTTNHIDSRTRSEPRLRPESPRMSRSIFSNSPPRIRSRSPRDSGIFTSSPQRSRLLNSRPRSPADSDSHSRTRRSPIDSRMRRRSPIDSRLRRRSPIDSRMRRRSLIDSRKRRESINDARDNSRAQSPDCDNRSDSNSNGESDGEEDDAEDPNIDPSIPDATHWTPDEVYQYFAQYFPEEAKIFKEQEIDGRSLLLLKRMDVLTNLNLKLGPALKIYRHVVKLQVRRDDRSLYWL